jgi:hypothetical protein
VKLFAWRPSCALSGARSWTYASHRRQAASLKRNQSLVVLPIAIMHKGLMLSVRCIDVKHDILKQPISGTYTNELITLIETKQRWLTYAIPSTVHAYTKCAAKKHHAPELNSVSNRARCERILLGT